MELQHPELLWQCCVPQPWHGAEMEQKEPLSISSKKPGEFGPGGSCAC